MKRILASLACLCMVSACIQRQANLHLHIDARTNQGEPVVRAIVSLDENPIGETSETGTLTTDVNVPFGVNRQLKVHKESDQFYFAPYFEAFHVGDGDVQELAVKATLYSVPKPSPEWDSPALRASQIAAQTPTSKREPGSDLSPIPIEDVSHSASSENTSQNSGRKAAAANQFVIDETTAQWPPEGGPSSEVAAAGVSEVDASRPLDRGLSVGSPALEALTEPETQISTAKETGPPALFTVYVYAADVPLGDVDVRMGETGATLLQPGCRTNSRGRCVIRFSTASRQPVSFVAMKKGYQTGESATQIEDKGKIRFSLSPGLSVNIFALSKVTGIDQGVENVDVFVGNRPVGRTDAFGRFSYSVQGSSEAPLFIRLAAEEYRPESYEDTVVPAKETSLVKYFTAKALSIADKQRRSGQTQGAIKSLESLGHDHPDYLLARHWLGEIYLSTLDQPEKAAEIFAEVTRAPKIKSFSDNRYLGAHVNEGVALARAGEHRLKTKPAEARVYYERALAIFVGVMGKLQTLPKDQYLLAMRTVDYHLALCRHRLGAQSSDPRIIGETIRLWRDYLEKSTGKMQPADESKAYVENAKLYLKQAIASLNAAESVQRR